MTAECNELSKGVEELGVMNAQLQHKLQIAMGALQYYSKSYLGREIKPGVYGFQYRTETGSINEIVYNTNIARKALGEIKE